MCTSDARILHYRRQTNLCLTIRFTDLFFSFFWSGEILDGLHVQGIDRYSTASHHDRWGEELGVNEPQQHFLLAWVIFQELEPTTQWPKAHMSTLRTWQIILPAWFSSMVYQNIWGILLYLNVILNLLVILLITNQKTKCMSVSLEIKLPAMWVYSFQIGIKLTLVVISCKLFLHKLCFKQTAVMLQSHTEAFQFITVQERFTATH